MGIGLGTIAAGTIGQGGVSMLMLFMGAARVEFVINPFVAYMLVPMLFLSVVFITTLLSSLNITETGKRTGAAKSFWK
ncbi:hypothetical protein D3C73_1610900 [compost metagenome]